MDKIKADWFLIACTSLETMGFCCATCANLDDGMCMWAGKMVNEDDFCTNWGEREHSND